MKIYFYEEFPTEENLKKLRLVDFPTTLVIAAKSIKHFHKLKKSILKRRKGIEFIYWPAVKTTYWMSPFSNTSDLKDFFEKLDGFGEKFLVDLEFPMKKKWMVLTNFFGLFRNKKIIREFIERNKKNVVLAMYPGCWGLTNFLLRVLGLDYDVFLERKPMFYTSYYRQHKIGFLLIYFYNGLKKIKDKSNYILGLGVIAKGKITKKVMSIEELERDLQFAKDAGFKEVIIFRLGGLDKEYMDVIKKFVD